MRTSDIKRLGEAFASVVSPQVGYTDDEIRELCHSKDHNCAVTVIHPQWGKGKPVYESHAIPDDEGNVEWYDVQFKHGLEKKVPASDMEIIEESSHNANKNKKPEKMIAGQVNKDNFKPHMMYDPKTGKGEMAKKYEDHVRLDKMGYVHDKPEVKEGFSEEEVRELCHSKDHNCAIIVNHPEWGLGKPVYESHAIPTDDGFVEWYDVEFKHGIEKRVPVADMEVIEESSHMGKEPKKKRPVAQEDNTNDKSDDGEGLDKVQPKAIKKKFANRKDKDIDNDGDVDSSDEYLHKRRKAVSKAIAKEAEHGDDENGEDKPDTANGDDEKKKKKNGNPKTDDKTAEISKIGEAIDELNSMFDRLWEQEHKGKRKQDQNNGEAYDDKESPKSKEFENAHKKSDKKIEDNYEDGVTKTTKAEKDGTKPKSGKRPQDNQSGDTNVKEDIDMDAKDGSISMVELARRELAGENRQNKENKNPFDGRTRAAKEFLERMNARRGK